MPESERNLIRSRKNSTHQNEAWKNEAAHQINNNTTQILQYELHDKKILNYCMLSVGMFKIKKVFFCYESQIWRVRKLQK